MRVLVCGGRDFDDRERLEAALRLLHKANGFSLLIQGGAKGADTMAREWAAKENIATLTFNPDWEAHGKAAGAIRNQQMIDEGMPSLVVAFPGGKGTEDMLNRARKAGLIIEEPMTWP